MRRTVFPHTHNLAPKRTITALLAVLSCVASLSLGAPAQGEGELGLRDYLSGNGLLNRGLYELAAVEYRKFLSEHGDHEKAAVARYGLAVSLFRLGKFDEAVIELSPLQRLPDFVYSAEVWSIAGQCYLASGRNADAAEAFRSVVERFGKHDLADDAAAGEIEALYAEKRYDDTATRCRTFITQWPDSLLRERTAYFEALSAMGKADYAVAAVAFETLLRTYPKSPFAVQAAFLLAQCHQQSNSIDKAIQQYRQVLQQKNGPYVADALASLGSLLYQQGHYREAGEVLDQLLEQFPQSSLLSQARMQRGRVWFELEKYELALEHFGRIAGAGSEFGDEVEYWTAKCQLRLGDSVGAASRLGNAIEEYSKSPLLAEMMFDRAVALLRSGDAGGAIAVLEDFRSQFTDHELSSDALQLLAITEHQQRRFDKSQVHCQAFIKLYPKHTLAASLRFLECENAFLSGQYSEAVVEYRNFLKNRPADPQSPKAKFRLATALYRLQKFDEAEPLLIELATLANQEEVYRPVLLALGDIYFQHGEWKSAELRLNEYVSTTADLPFLDDALLKLGLSRQRQERDDEALQVYDRLIEQYPQSPHRIQAMFERGQVLVRLKRLDEAVKAFEAVVAEDDDSRFAPHALNHLAAIAAQRNDMQLAASLYARVAQGSPGAESEAEAMFQQGQSLMAAQQFADAERAYARLIERFASHPRVAEARARLAIAVARQDRHADAIAAIERAESDSSAKLEPTLRVTLNYEKAWCYRALDKLDEAAKAYRQVLAEAPVGALDLHAMLELAEIESTAKRLDAAALVLRKLRKVLAVRSAEAPGDVVEQCTYRLGVCEFELERFEDAAKLFEEFINTYPKSKLIASASFYCGDALFHMGRHERAVPYLTRVVKEFDADPAASASLLRLGECQAALQRWALSEQAFAAYLDRSPEGDRWYQARFGLGWRENQQHYDEAVAAYQKVVEHHQGPTAARAQFQIGQCLFAQQKYEDAVRELLKVDILYAYPEWSAAALYEAARCFEKLGKTAEAKRHFQQVEEKYQQSQWAKLAAQRLSELSLNVSLPGR